MYVYQHKNWPQWNWDNDLIHSRLLSLVARQNQLLGKLNLLGFDVQDRTAFEAEVLDILKNSEIEGEKIDEEQIRSSIAKNLSIYYPENQSKNSEKSEGALNLYLDATRNYQDAISAERLFNWHAALFPYGRSSGIKIDVATWRISSEPMQIVSGAMGREKVHYVAPAADQLVAMMNEFILWYNSKNIIHPYLKAGIAHLWFEVIHPFDDGNGRIGRALVDKLLCEADQSKHRYYSFSNAVMLDKKEYYKKLNDVSSSSLDITEWLIWFFSIVEKAIINAESILQQVDAKRRFWLKFAELSFNERQLKTIKKMLEGFEGNISSSKWSRMNKCTKMTANRDINELLNHQVLIKNAAGGRSSSYRLVEH